MVGGGKGAGSFGMAGKVFVRLTNACASLAVSSSSIGSLALGTSDRNSKSSEESAKEFLGLDLPRENLLKNRETAEGGTGSSGKKSGPWV